MSNDRSKERASIFGDDDGPPKVDLSRFQPKSKPEAPDKDVVRAVSEANKFPSRQPISEAPAPESSRPRRVHRTGRNVQLNIKVSQEVAAKLYELRDARPRQTFADVLEMLLDVYDAHGGDPNA